MLPRPCAGQVYVPPCSARSLMPSSILRSITKWGARGARRRDPRRPAWRLTSRQQPRPPVGQRAQDEGPAFQREGVRGVEHPDAQAHRRVQRDLLADLAVLPFRVDGVGVGIRQPARFSSPCSCRSRRGPGRSAPATARRPRPARRSSPPGSSARWGRPLLVAGQDRHALLLGRTPAVHARAQEAVIGDRARGEGERERPRSPTAAQRAELARRPTSQAAWRASAGPKTTARPRARVEAVAGSAASDVSAGSPSVISVGTMCGIGSSSAPSSPTERAVASTGGPGVGERRARPTTTASRGARSRCAERVTGTDGEVDRTGLLSPSRTAPRTPRGRSAGAKRRRPA